MTEEEFWKSNPAKMQAWEKAWREQEKRKNTMIHAFVGHYGISALCFAIDHCLNGRKAKSVYIEKPIQIFELTEEEKEIEVMKARQAFIAWAGMTESKVKSKNKK